MEFQSDNVEIKAVKLKKKFRDGEREKLVGINFIAQVENGKAFAATAFPGLGPHCWKDSGVPNTSGWNLTFSDKFYNYRVKLFNSHTGEIIADCPAGDISGLEAQILPRYAVAIKGSISAHTRMNVEELHDWMKEMGLAMSISPSQIDIETVQDAA